MVGGSDLVALLMGELAANALVSQRRWPESAFVIGASTAVGDLWVP